MESNPEVEEIIDLSPEASDALGAKWNEGYDQNINNDDSFNELEIINDQKQDPKDKEEKEKTNILDEIGHFAFADSSLAGNDNVSISYEPTDNNKDSRTNFFQSAVINPFRESTPKAESNGSKRMRLDSLNTVPNFFRDHLQSKAPKPSKVSIGGIYTPASGEDISESSDDPPVSNKGFDSQNNIHGNFPSIKRPNVSTLVDLDRTKNANVSDNVELITVDSDEESNTKSPHSIVESDDDIIILDANEAAQSGKFKPSSFERGNVSINENSAIHDSDPSFVYNGPLPGYYEPDSEVSIDERRSAEAQQKLERYIQEQSSLLADQRSVSQERERYLSALNFTTESVVNLTAQANAYKNKTDGQSIQLYQSIANVLMDKNAHLHKLQAKFAETKAKFDGLTSRMANISNAIRTLSVNNSINLNSVFANRFISNPGYASNIYTNTGDEQHLQKLLDDIRPDEELVDGLELTPPELAVSLLKHQRLGLSWLLKKEESEKCGAILADDMGLGKTVQALALILSNRASKGEEKTNLIVAPVSLLRQWSAEITSKIKPSVELKLGVFHGAEKKALMSPKVLLSYDIILTSYGTLASEWKKHYSEALKEANVNRNRNVLPDLGAGGKSYVSPFFDQETTFYRIILDEAQNIKNKLAINSKAAACLKGNKRLCLSGTPMQNNVEELYPLIRFLKIRPYSNELRFRSDIALPLKSKTNSNDYSKKQSLNKLRAVLKAILLRRSKNSLIDGKPILTLPEKHIISDSISMGEEESEFYTNLESGIQKKARRLFNEKSVGSVSNILVLLLKLRQACCHSLLVDIGEFRKAKQEKSNGINLSEISSIYNQAQTVKPNVQQVIRDAVNECKEYSEGAFSCPMCFDVFDLNSVMIFSQCGHMICENCVDDFFIKNEVGDSDKARIASCISCKCIVKDFEVIHYSHYDKIMNEGYSFQQLEGLISSSTHAVTKLGNNDIIKRLLKNDKLKPSAKLQKCISLIKHIFNSYPGEKIIIFSQFTTLFDIMKLVLDENDIKYLRYDGSMSLNDRNLTIKKFYQEETKVLLLSLKSGNVGLTLTCASHIIMMDPFWNPYVEEQAMDRAHRIGQQREVYVHRILLQNTIESRIMELQQNKKRLIESALDENGMKSVGRLGQRELGFLFGLNSLR